MYNLLIALAVTLVAFALGALGGRWYYGFAPALLVFPAAWFLLARRTGKQLEGLMKQAQDAMMRQDLKGAKAALESGLPLGKWQLLVAEQIYAQLGALEYIQRNYQAARPLLEKAWKRNWQAQGMLACLDSREGRREEGLKRLQKARLLARKEPLMWGLTAHLQLEAGSRDGALAAVNEGLAAQPDSKVLKELKDAIANDRMKGYAWDKHFGEVWFQFFPEEAWQRATRAHKQQLIEARRGGPMSQPHPRR